MPVDYPASSFPPDWIIYGSQAFEITEAGDNASLVGQLYLQVKKYL